MSIPSFQTHDTEGINKLVDISIKQTLIEVEKLINELLPKYYEDGADEFARQLLFALHENTGAKK